MKKVFFFLLLCIFGCAKKNIQVFDTTAINSILKDEYYVYETDTIRITYLFWEDKGLMNFTVFNKLDKPLYIDWKNSAFIQNDKKIDYWADEQKTDAKSYYKGHTYSYLHSNARGITLTNGVQISQSTTIKEERITFIPPKSNYSRCQFYLFPEIQFYFTPKCSSVVVARNDNPKKETIVICEKFDQNNTPLRFRNYLALSDQENGQKCFFIDNGFFLSSVQQMDFIHFNGKQIKGVNASYIEYEKPSKKKTSFYILPPIKNTSVDY